VEAHFEGLKGSQTGQIDIYRPHRYFAFLRSYSIWIDGRKVRRISDRERVFIPVPQGVHNIFLKIDWVRSNKIELKIATGETVKLLVWYKHFGGFRSIVLKCLYIGIIAIGAAVSPLLIGIGAGLLVLHRTGKLHLYQIKT
jgi:hypothetical protein